jgi:hypothetical protein
VIERLEASLMFRNNAAALSLVVALVLAGCGSKAGSLSMTAVPAAPGGSAPSVNVTALAEGQVTVSRQHTVDPTAVSSLRAVGAEAMTDEELADDAQSVGYSVQSSLGKNVTKTGVVRRTETGLVLEVTSGIFTKTTETFKLSASGEAQTTLMDRQNKKATVKGSLDVPTNVITVNEAKNSLDLGFLTNWLTRGKISGAVSDPATKLPLAGVLVEAKSEDGYVFADTTDGSGEFQIKTLTAGKYSLKLSKAGYTGVTSGEHPAEVKARTNLKYLAELSAAATGAAL